MFDHLERAELATLPTPIEVGPTLPGGARLVIQRDDLTGLGGGGNKARKLEFLCGDALSVGARSLVTVGASQSNHCRITAAAGAKLGLAVHLVLAGAPADPPTGNQLLSRLFGAELHHTGVDASRWGELEAAREAVTDELRSEGSEPYSIPIGGSTAVGAVGYAAGFVELLDQCRGAGIDPVAVVFASASGGTHAGLLAGRAMSAASGAAVPDVIAVGAAPGVHLEAAYVAELAREALALTGGTAAVDAGDVEVDARWIGDDYGVPTAAGDDAIRWAARRGGWMLDRTYTGKGLSGLLGMAAEGRFPAGRNVVFVHTGGWPALFAPGGAPALDR